MKNMRKNFLNAILALVMLFVLAACGNAAQPAGSEASNAVPAASEEAAANASENAGESVAGEAKAEDSDKAYVQEKGSLIVGVTLLEPLDFQENGDWTGFDAELARVFGERLGVNVEFQEINWESKEVELAAKTIDAIWNGLTYTDERAQQMGLSDPYLINRQVFVAPQDKMAEYAAPADLAGKNIGAESGSAGADLVTSVLADATFIEKTTQLDALTEAALGTVDGVVIDRIMADYLLNKEGSDFAALTTNLDLLGAEDENYVVAFRQGSNLVEEVNALFAEMKEDGSLTTLAEKYGLAEALTK